MWSKTPMHSGNLSTEKKHLQVSIILTLFPV